MVYFLAYIESVGFYGKDWVHDFRKATWFETLEEAMAIPAETYLRADIEVYEHGDHSKSPIIKHRHGKYRLYCRHCHQQIGNGQYTRAQALREYQQNVSAKCETIILRRLQNTRKKQCE